MMFPQNPQVPTIQGPIGALVPYIVGSWGVMVQRLTLGRIGVAKVSAARMAWPTLRAL